MCRTKADSAALRRSNVMTKMDDGLHRQRILKTMSDARAGSEHGTRRRKNDGVNRTPARRSRISCRREKPLPVTLQAQPRMKQSDSDSDRLFAERRSSGNSLNPAATHAALPTISPEAESFSNFLTEKIRYHGKRRPESQRESAGSGDARADVNYFAVWAEQQKQSEWSNSARSQRFEAAPAQVKEKVSSVFEQARQAKSGDG